jgi:hypothetical protein
MPLYLAQKLCPQLIWSVTVSPFPSFRPFQSLMTVLSLSVKLSPDLYVKASREIMQIYERYGPIAPASLDEACAFHSSSPFLLSCSPSTLSQSSTSLSTARTRASPPPKRSLAFAPRFARLPVRRPSFVPFFSPSDASVARSDRICRCQREQGSLEDCGCVVDRAFLAPPHH